MATMQEVRQKYPDYADLSDDQLAKALHKKFYSDVPYERFAQSVGAPMAAASEPAPEASGFPNPLAAINRLAMKGGAAIRGDAAEDIPSAVGSSEFRGARWDASKGRGYLDNMGRERRETAAALFGNDEDLTRELAASVPGAQVTQDANGNPVIELPGGQRVYPNKPGLDAQDAIRFAGNAATYLPAGRAARWLAGGSTFGKAAITGGLAAATNAGGQAAAGRESVDLGEVGLTGLFGSGAEFAGPVLGKITQAMSKNTATGQARAAQILTRDLGVQQPTYGQVQSFSKALDEIDAGADPAAVLGSSEFGFIYTKGRRLRDGSPSKFGVLTREEALRQDSGMAGNAMRSVDDHNRDTLGRVVEEQVSGGSPTGPTTPVEAFERVGERVGGMANELQKKVGGAYERASASGRAVVSTDAVREVPGRLRAALREFPSDPKLTPATRSMLDEISGKVAQLEQGTKGVTLRAIEEQRRIIGSAFGATANPTDRAALRALKGEYDRWLDDAFDSALIQGDEQALAAMKEARGLRAEFGRRFEGDADVDRFIAQMVEGEKTPDELIGVALGASHVSKASAARFIERLRTASGADPEVMGALKAAHLMRLFQDKRGGVLGMSAIRNNILTAERETPSVIRSLYGDAQWSQVKRLSQSLEPLIDKGTFARRPGTADQLLRQMMSLPFIGRAIDAVRQPVNIGRAYGSTGPLARPPSPASIPAAAAAAGSDYRQANGG